MSSNEDKISEIIKRLNALEKIVFSENKKPLFKNLDFKGLRGGMRLLIKNGFFDEPKMVKEIEDELKREGYHYPRPSISKVLSVDLTNKQKILNRLKKNEQWMYVIRK